MPHRTEVKATDESTAAGRGRGLLARWVREPLVHFLVAGLALFVLYGALNLQRSGEADGRRIVLSAEDIRRLETSWIANWRRLPQPAEMRELIEAQVREEVLYREALALGLDKGDTIVKRRLAQKMEFLAEDFAAARDPGPGELKAWFEANRQRFALPPRATFRHIYFSPDRRPGRAAEDARRALAAAGTAPSADPGAGDAFPFQGHYGDRTPDEVAGVFGAKFAEALFKLEPGAWRGPVESGYGWHLVRIESIARSRESAFEEVERDAKREWQADQRASAKRKAYEAMRSRYTVVIPESQ